MKTTAEKIAVMQAFEDGKMIEQFSKQNTVTFNKCNFAYNQSPVWDWGNYDYRIKEECKCCECTHDKIAIYMTGNTDDKISVRCYCCQKELSRTIYHGEGSIIRLGSSDGEKYDCHSRHMSLNKEYICERVIYAGECKPKEEVKEDCNNKQSRILDNLNLFELDLYRILAKDIHCGDYLLIMDVTDRYVFTYVNFTCISSDGTVSINNKYKFNSFSKILIKHLNKKLC